MRASRRSVVAGLSWGLLSGSSAAQSIQGSTMELVVDHVMFPIYFNNPFLGLVEEIWRDRKVGRVFSQPQNPSFKGLYLRSKSFYLEYASNTKNEPYWSNAVYVVVPKKYWNFYEEPVLRTEHFLLPKFGGGYSIVSPEYPHLNSSAAQNETYDGLTLLISKALEDELLQVAGQKWTLPRSGKVRVHDGLKHLTDIAVIDEQSKLVAPLLEANPLLREFL
jgi:hypothetical protein